MTRRKGSDMPIGTALAGMHALEQARNDFRRGTPRRFVPRAGRRMLAVLTADDDASEVRRRPLGAIPFRRARRG